MYCVFLYLMQNLKFDFRLFTITFVAIQYFKSFFVWTVILSGWQSDPIKAENWQNQIGDLNDPENWYDQIGDGDVTLFVAENCTKSDLCYLYLRFVLSQNLKNPWSDRPVVQLLLPRGQWLFIAFDLFICKPLQTIRLTCKELFRHASSLFCIGAQFIHLWLWGRDSTSVSLLVIAVVCREVSW